MARPRLQDGVPGERVRQKNVALTTRQVEVVEEAMKVTGMKQTDAIRWLIEVAAHFRGQWGAPTINGKKLKESIKHQDIDPFKRGV